LAPASRRPWISPTRRDNRSAICLECSPGPALDEEARMRRLCFGNSCMSLVLLIASCAASAHAATLQVSLQTTSLMGGSYSLIFDLINGDAVQNNTVMLTNFQFGGGGVAGSPALTGDATGDLASAATLRDTTFFNEILQAFSAGTVLNFH